MSIKKIRQHNDQQFLDDFKSVRQILISPRNTGAYFNVSKKEVKERAEEQIIHYYLTDKIFAVKRTVMVVI